jgi:hypothetical protein
VAVADGGWSGAEVMLPKSLGYGSYNWKLSHNPAQTTTNMAGGMFLYENSEHRHLLPRAWGFCGERMLLVVTGSVVSQLCQRRARPPRMALTGIPFPAANNRTTRV